LDNTVSSLGWYRVYGTWFLNMGGVIELNVLDGAFGWPL
jgi:hypothetical protein